MYFKVCFLFKEIFNFRTVSDFMLASHPTPPPIQTGENWNILQ